MAGHNVSRADSGLDLGDSARVKLLSDRVRQLRCLLVEIGDDVAVALLVRDLELAAPVLDNLASFDSGSTPSTTLYSFPGERFSTSVV